MKHYKIISCPSCKATNLKKNGRSSKGTQRYLCKSCKKSFREHYSYNACKPGMKEKIDKQILNSGGVRDTARVLNISKDTVVAHLKKKSKTGKSLLN